MKQGEMILALAIGLQQQAYARCEPLNDAEAIAKATEALGAFEARREPAAP